jgi:adenylate kinase family enzyme
MRAGMTAGTDPDGEGRPVDAVLLLGPTGAGKTPLGDCLASASLWGRTCRHFDFGERLRRCAASDRPPPGLSEQDLSVVRRALTTGALLEDGEFHIAAALLRQAAVEGGADPRRLLILNGLPRHAGQAAAVEPIAAVRAVVFLRCDPATAGERIRLNSGGDRGGRTDDSADEVRRKLELFEGRTRPLLDHYRRRGVFVMGLDVAARMSAEDMRARIESVGGPGREDT